MSIRVRFAPSPTGYLHIGGARTALFNWLYARHTGGTFVLRIEDTDTARNTQEAVDVILSGLRWLGLDWDEGPLTGDPKGPSKGEYGSYFQSQRGDLYKKRVQELKDKGLAYDHEGAVKFRMTREPILMPDLVKGDVTRELTDREQGDPDFVIVRSDGQSVFHFVNVVDDLEMKITHVIRGEDHLSNTPKHIALFRAFGVEPPKYGHIPLILNPEGSKMGKRDKGASLNTYLEEGFLPEAVINYISLLGWSPKNNLEKMSREDMVKLFDLPGILSSNSKFDFEKLLWFNGEYIREIPPERFRQLGLEALQRAKLPLQNYSSEYVTAALDTCRGKVKSFGELPQYAGFYFAEEVKVAPEAITKDFTPENLPRIKKLRDAFAQAPEFTGANLELALKAVAAECAVKAGVLVHPVRMACTGNSAGPSLYHLLEVLGKERVLKRLDAAMTQG